ncbi:MAG: sigma-70 family RNA polymerase sigma factor, partial [Microbacterium sp.]
MGIERHKLRAPRLTQHSDAARARSLYARTTTMKSTDDAHPDTPSDHDLVVRTRTGDADAFGELVRRHYRSGISVAQSITSSIDPDDLVQEAYTRVFRSIQRGGGPTGSFRAYLFASVRNAAASWGRAPRETPIEELDAVAEPAPSLHDSDDALDRGLTHQAFRSLPSRWQEVLWYTEIEQMKPSEIAPLLGMKPSAVAQLAFRAREGLRAAWIQAHLRSVSDDSPCAWTIHRLGAYARGTLSRRDHTRIEEHLAVCARCTIVAAEATEVSHRLAMILLPLTIGAGATTAYLASVQGGGTALVAMAAQGGAVVSGSPGGGATGGGTPAGSASAGSASAGSASAGSSSAGAGGAGATAGVGATGVGAILSSAGGMVALVGAVVAGVAVTAALAIPSIVSAAPATTAPTSATMPPALERMAPTP